MNVTCLLISCPPIRWVGADLATLRYVSELDSTATVYTPAAETSYEYEGLRIRPYSIYVPAPPAPPVSDVFVTNIYGSKILVAAMRTFEADRRILMLHSTTPWMVESFHAIKDDFDEWVVNSRATADAAGADVWKHPKTSILHPKIHRAFQQDRAPAPVRHPTVMMVNPIPGKGSKELAQLMAIRPDWHYRVVAGGYGTSDITALTTTASATGASLELIAKQVPPHELAQLYATSTVLIQPSYHESYGMVALEARTVGTPVVVTDLPGVHEALSGFSDGVEYIPAPPTVKELHNAVQRFLDGSIHA